MRDYSPYPDAPFFLLPGPTNYPIQNAKMKKFYFHSLILLSNGIRGVLYRPLPLFVWANSWQFGYKSIACPLHPSSSYQIIPVPTIPSPPTTPFYSKYKKQKSQHRTST
jgi:hypothetical protein